MSVRVIRSSIILGLCLLSGCTIFNEATLKSGSPEEVREELSAMLNETNASSQFRLFLGANNNSYLSLGVRDLVSVMNNESLATSDCSNYPEQTRLEAIRQLIEYSKTPKANTPCGDKQKIPAEGIRAALVYTYNTTATDAMKREILRFFDKPEMYPELISKGELISGDLDGWIPMVIPVVILGTPSYLASSSHYHGTFTPSISDWRGVFEACPSQAQWGALFDKVAVPLAQKFERGERLDLQRRGRWGNRWWQSLGELYNKIKQPTYNQKKLALLLCHTEDFIPDLQFIELNVRQLLVAGGFVDGVSDTRLKVMSDYQAYVNTITPYQKKILSSMPKSEVQKVLKELEPLQQKKTAYYYLYAWIWMERVATHQQQEAFLAQERNKVQQFNQPKIDACRKALLASRERNNRKTVGIQCKYCECGWMTNATEAYAWLLKKRINDLGDLEPFDMDDREYLDRFVIWCNCPHARSNHRIISK